MMDRIARVTEASNPAIFGRSEPQNLSTTLSVARAATALAPEVRARAIVVITRTGRTAQVLSKLRPRQPLIAFTEQESTARRLALWWGVQCYATAFQANTDAMIEHIERELTRRRLVAAGETIVLVGSAPVVVHGRVNFVKVHRVRRAGR